MRPGTDLAVQYSNGEYRQFLHVFLLNEVLPSTDLNAGVITESRSLSYPWPLPDEKPSLEFIRALYHMGMTRGWPAQWRSFWAEWRTISQSANSYAFEKSLAAGESSPFLYTHVHGPYMQLWPTNGPQGIAQVLTDTKREARLAGQREVLNNYRNVNILKSDPAVERAMIRDLHEFVVRAVLNKFEPYRVTSKEMEECA